MDTLPIPLVAKIVTRLGSRDLCVFASSSRFFCKAVDEVIAYRPFYVIQAGNDDTDTRQERLCWASRKGLEYDVDVLITVGGVKLDSALQQASQNGHIDVVNRLLEAGANVHAMEDIALRLAAENGHLEVVERLLTRGADVKGYALMYAVFKGRREVVKRLLAAGANVRDNSDYALRLASCRGHLEVVKCLLAAGAYVHAERDYSLRIASCRGHLEVVKCLLAAGANVHALRSASKSYHLDVAELKKYSIAGVWDVRTVLKTCSTPFRFLARIVKKSKSRMLNYMDTYSR